MNRVIPDADIESFTDALARRIAAFDKVAVAGIKQLVDVATLPKEGEFAPGLQAYFATAGRPENRPFAQLLVQNGLQQPDGSAPAFPETRAGRTARLRAGCVVLC